MTSSTGSTWRAAAPPSTRTFSRGRHTTSPSPPPDEEDEDDENYHVVKEAAM
jgi:hypothetical protein